MKSKFKLRLSVWIALLSVIFLDLALWKVDEMLEHRSVGIDPHGVYNFLGNCNASVGNDTVASLKKRLVSVKITPTGRWSSFYEGRDPVISGRVITDSKGTIEACTIDNADGWRTH